MTSDSATGFSLPPDERPLGIQQPFLPSLPLGQSVLQPKFLTPLGARSLTVLDPNLFSTDSAALGSDPGLPFQDSPFFDGPSDRAESSNMATPSLPSTAPSTAPSASPPTLQPKLENPALETEDSPPTEAQRGEDWEPPSANGNDFAEWEQPAAIASPEPIVESSSPATLQPKLESQPTAPTIQAMSEVSGFEIPERSPEEEPQGAIASPEPTFESPTPTPATLQPKLESQPTAPTIQAASEVSGFEMPERSPEEEPQGAISSPEPIFESSISTPASVQPKLESQPTAPTIQAASEISGFEMPERSPEEEPQGALSSPEPTFESPTPTPESIQPKLESQLATPTIQAMPEVSGFELPERSPEEEPQGAIASPEPTFGSPTPATIQPKLESQPTAPTIQAVSEVSGFEMPERSPEEEPQGAIASPEPTFGSPTPATIQPKLESQPTAPTIQAASEVSEFEMPERSPEEEPQGAIASPEPIFESSTSTSESIQPKLESQPTAPTIQAAGEVSGFEIPERSPEEEPQSAIALPEPTFESSTSTPESIQPKLESQSTAPTIQAAREVSGLEIPERSPEEEPQAAIAIPESTIELPTSTPESIQPKLESQLSTPTIQAMPEVSGFEMPERSPEEEPQGAISSPAPTFESPTPTPETIQPKLESQPIEPTVQAMPEVSAFEIPERSPEEEPQGAIASPEPMFESPTPTPAAIQPKLESQPAAPTIQAASEVSEFEISERSLDEEPQGAIATPEPTFESPTPTPATIQPKLESQPIEPTIQAMPEVSGFEMPERSPEEEPQGAIALPEATSELSTAADSSTLQPKSDTPLIAPQQAAPEPPRSQDSQPASSTTTTALPELPATLQRLSVWEPLIQTQPLNAAIAPHLTPPVLQPALAIPTADRTPPSTSASTPESSTAFEPFSLASDRPSNTANSSPAPSEWSSIAELLQSDASSSQTPPVQAAAAPVDSPATRSPDITPADGYTDLRLYPEDPNASVLATVQRVGETSEAIAAPPSNNPTPEQASEEYSASASPEQLEQLAQAVYRLVRQRLALERERGGHPPPGRFS